MLALLVSPLACQAGDPNAPPDNEELVDRIVGGQTATYKEYRWIASLRTGEDDHFCGGSLIAERWVATAAHCLCSDKLESVVVGGFDVSDSNDGVRRGIARAISHPSFECDGNLEHDIALLELDATTESIPIAINDDPQFPDPVALASAGSTADNSVAIGWGLDQNGVYPDKLKDVQVPVVTNAACDAAYGGIIAEQICAGHTTGGEDACFGDSGGPLIGYDYSQPFLIGATSFGNGCALPGFPGVYTRVSSYVEWFRSHAVPFTTRSDLERPSDPARLVGLGGVSNAAKRKHLFATTGNAHLRYYRGELNNTWSADSPGPGNWNIGEVAALEGPERGDFGVPHYSAYARRDDGSLVMFERTAAGPWDVDDITGMTGGHDIDGDPYVTRGPRTATGEETRHVFATGQGDQGQDGSIIHYYGSPLLPWASEDLSTVTGAGPDERAVGRLALLNSAGMADVGGRSMQVYFRGPADNLAHYYWSKQHGWATEDLSQRLEDEGDLGGAEIRIAGDPVAINGDSAHNYGVRSQHVFATNVDGHLAHYYWTNVDSWAAENLTDRTGAGSDGEIDGVPMVINGPIRGNGGVRSMHVFGRNQTHDLVHYWWINYAGWQFENLTAKFGNGETIDGDPHGFIGTVVGNSGVQDIHLYARRGTDLIHYWWLNYQGWQAENLSNAVVHPGGTAPLVRDPLVALQGPRKGNGGIEAHHVYTKPMSLDPYDFAWINHSGWSWRYLGFP